MEQSSLVPFIRKNLDILFVGLNPAKGSSRNGHYFSMNQALWNQLHEAGLITKRVSKINADDIIFGSNTHNYRQWEYGVTDLVTAVAESDSSKVEPSRQNCEELQDLIQKASPKTAILLHGKVRSHFLKFLGQTTPTANSGQLGKLIPNCSTLFFDIAFPHGNPIKSQSKVAQYKKVKQYLEDFT